MQKILFLDYMDGSRALTPKIFIDKNIAVYVAMFKRASRIKPIMKKHGLIFDHESFRKELAKDHEYLDCDLRLYDQDASMKATIEDYGLFYNFPGRKNYVFSGALSKALSETHIDQDTSIISGERSFYFEMQNIKFKEKDLICVFGYVVKFEAMELLILQLVEKNKDKHHLKSIGLEIKQGVKFSDSFSNTLKSTKHPHHEYQDIDYSKESVYRTALNGVIYICNNSEEMDEKLNSFAEKKSKIETQMKIYTEKPYVELGSDFIYLRLIKEGESDVRGHYRWQPCGEGRRQVKLTFVKPHVRSINRLIPTEAQPI